MLEKAGCHVIYGLVGLKDTQQDHAGGTQRRRQASAVMYIWLPVTTMIPQQNFIQTVVSLTC